MRRTGVFLVAILVVAGTAPALICDWQWAHPLPPQVDLHRAVFSNGLYVAVGDDGTIVTSSDGRLWTLRQSWTTAHLYSVAWGGGVFVVVGQEGPGGDGVVLTSSNGVTWTERRRVAGAELLGAAWGEGVWVVVGRDLGGRVLTSTDARSWSAQQTGWEEIGDTVLWTGSAFVAGAYELFSSTDGITWTPLGSVPRAPAAKSVLSDRVELAWDGAGFVWAGGMDVYASTFGAVWEHRVELDGDPAMSGFVGVFARPGLAVASGVNNFPHAPLPPSATVLHASTDGGGTWAQVWDDAGGGLPGVAVGGWSAVAVGALGDVLWGSDGLHWSCLPGSCASTLCDNGFSDVTDGSYGLVAVGGVVECSSWPKNVSRGTAAFSPDGEEWSVVELPCGWLSGVTWGDEGYVAVGSGVGYCAATSLDGVQWSTHVLDAIGKPASVAFGDGVYVMVGQGGAVSTSADGEQWSAGQAGFDANLNRVEWDGDRFLAVGTGGTILLSPDGETWTAASAGFPFTSFRGVTRGRDRYYAVGSGGVVASSTFGTNWQPVGPDLCADQACVLEDVTWDGQYLVVVGVEWHPNRPLVLISADGAHWTAFRPAPAAPLRSVEHSVSGFVAVGEERTLLNAPCPGLLADLDPVEASLAVGETARLTLTVSEFVQQAMVVELESSDPGAVSVPPRVSLPGWQVEVDLPVHARRIADSVRVTATLPQSVGGGSTTAVVRVVQPAPRRPRGRLP